MHKLYLLYLMECFKDSGTPKRGVRPKVGLGLERWKSMVKSGH